MHAVSDSAASTNENSLYALGPRMAAHYTRGSPCERIALRADGVLLLCASDERRPSRRRRKPGSSPSAVSSASESKQRAARIRRNETSSGSSPWSSPWRSRRFHRFPRWSVPDRTVEQLEVELMQQDGTLLLASEEAGALLAIMGGRYTRDGSLQLDVYLKAYDRGGDRRYPDQPGTCALFDPRALALHHAAANAPAAASCPAGVP